MAVPRSNGGRNDEPSLMQNLEGFFRGIVEGLDEEKQPEPPAQEPTDAQSREVGRKVQEVRRGNYIYRRTTIDEVIFDPISQDPGKQDHGKQDHGKHDDTKR